MGERSPLVTGTNVIKQYLRALPELLFTPDAIEQLKAAVGASADADRFTLMRDAISSLPEPNRVLTHRLMALLSELADSEGNLMTAENLAIVFTPVVLWRTEAVGQVSGLEEAQEAMRLLIGAWSTLYRLTRGPSLGGDSAPLTRRSVHASVASALGGKAPSSAAAQVAKPRSGLASAATSAASVPADDAESSSSSSSGAEMPIVDLDARAPAGDDDDDDDMDMEQFSRTFEKLPNVRVSRAYGSTIDLLVSVSCNSLVFLTRVFH